jgi:cytoskeleton protein RodZ
MDVGARLRSARERRGQTIDQVARSTKLSLSVVRRIERNEWDGLPGGLLTRGHLRAYAAEVGLDPEDIVREYLEQLPAETIQAPPLRVRPAPVLDGSRPTAHAILTVVVGILLTIGTWRWFANPPSGPTTPARVPAELPADDERTDDRAKAPDAVAVTNRPAADRQEPRFSLAIDATGPCWVSARADGRQVVFRLFQQGETFTVSATQELILRVGDPGSLNYTLNGVEGRPLGARGQPVTVTINESTLRSLVPN